MRLVQPFARKLDVWVHEGLITAAQKEAIEAFEQRDTERDTATVSIAEALGYIGAALAFGALGLVVQGVWEQLVPLGRIGLSLAAVLIFGASAYLLEDRPGETAQRLTSVLTAVTVVLLAATTALVLDTNTDWYSQTQVAIVAVVFATAAGVSYGRRQRPLAVVVLFASGLGLIAAALAQPIVTVNMFAAAMLFWVYALSWLLLAIGEWITPRRPALILGAIGSVIALQVARAGSVPWAPLLLGILTAAGLVWFALRINDQVILAIAAITVFLFVPQLTFLVFADSLGAAGALFVAGLLLVLGGTLSSRLRRSPVVQPVAEQQTESSDDDV